MQVGLFLAFVGAAAVVWLLRRFGWLHHRSWYRFVPKFLFWNGVGFLIPAHLYLDGLILAVSAIVIDAWRAGRRAKQLAAPE